jgi:nucleotide-binding universal stress UspA family protein
MKRFKSILLIFDPESKTQAAIDHAKSLAKGNAAQVTIFSVIKNLPSDLSMAITAIPPQELFALVIKERREQADALVDKMNQQGIKATAKVVSGTPFLEIIRQVLREKHDLVIIAAEGKGGLAERLFGSTSMHLMRKCPCPVWVVKPTHRKKYKHILAAVDTTNDFPDAQRDSLNPLILQLASSMAQMDKGELHVVQVWSVYGEGYMSARGGLSDKSINKLRTLARQQYSSQVDRLLADVDIEGVSVHKHLPRSIDISRAITSLAKNKESDLLVMGTLCRSGVAGFLIGNTAEKVLNKVDCSVLTVKPEGFVTPVTLEDA